jgi:hypothetical protein
MQGRAVYDALCSYVDNDTGETVADPERIADEFQMSIRNAQRIIRELRAIRAIVLITRGVDAFYRVNREHPESVIDVGLRRRQICHPTTNLSLNAPGVATNLSSDDKSVVRNKEELDSNTKPVLQGEVVSTLQEEAPPDHDDFCSSVAAAQNLLLPLAVSGQQWLTTLTGSIDIVLSRQRCSRRIAMQFLLATWELYESRHGQKEKIFWFRDGDFLKPDGGLVTHGTDTSRRDQPRSAQGRKVATLYASCDEAEEVADGHDGGAFEPARWTGG